MIPARGPQTVVEQTYIERILTILKFQIYFQAVRARAAVISGKTIVAHARGQVPRASHLSLLPGFSINYLPITVSAAWLGKSRQV